MLHFRNVFAGLKLHLHTINAVSLHDLWYPRIDYKRQYAGKILLNIEKIFMYMRASGVSELRKYFEFSHSKTATSFKICWYIRYFISTNGMLGGLLCG